MADTPVSVIDTLLTDATAEVDDPEVRYKLRTARQLIDAMEHHQNGLVAVAAEAASGDEVQTQLHEGKHSE